MSATNEINFRRTDTGKPILSWAIIGRNCEKTVEAMLRSLRERTPQAEIVYVDTMSSDGSPEIAKKYADVFIEYKGPRGDWSREMYAFDDAAAARQYAFEHATGTWRGWIDTDDRLAGPDEAEHLLKLNNRWQPEPEAKKKVIADPAKGAPIGLEEILSKAGDLMPGVDVFWAPYLYQRNTDGTAVTWQMRERIVRWDEKPNWRWAEAAHEILVPVPGHVPTRIDLTSLLFVHEKEFSQEEMHYNIKRHFDINLTLYNQNDRTTRRCLYLSEGAKIHAPERVLEFIEEAHRLATTPTDRYRAHLSRGLYFGDAGLYWDAMEAFGAAAQLRPLPDAWVAGADYWIKIDDYDRAIEWLEKGLSMPYDATESYVSARDLAVRYPATLAREYGRRALKRRDKGFHKEALADFTRATQLWTNVANSHAIGADKVEAHNYAIRALNEQRSEEHAIELERLAKFLFDNDEPYKVAALLKAIPHTLLDHPIVIGIERNVAATVKHVGDGTINADYQAFYESTTETGYMPSLPEWLEPGKCLSRATWMAEWINANMPNARVLDLGCFDGIVGIPILRMCPGITYRGLDLMPKALDDFRARIAEFDLGDRAQVERSSDPLFFGTEVFDVVIWSEVIEHVPDPGAELARMRGALKHEGTIFITTPWGSFDKGRPPEITIEGHRRDERGHVRVLMPREVTDLMEKTWEVEDLHFVESAFTGDSMHVRARKTTPLSAPPVRVVVPGALWDWSASTIGRGGMGASEGMIVYLANELAKGRRTEVYGPVPHAEVKNGVRYWPREHLRHIRDGKLLVSRSPLSAPFLDLAIGRKLPKVLWLQDAYYPDLTPESAEHYEKIVVVSEWHKRTMHDLHSVPLDKMEVIYNWVLPEHYAGPAPARKRDRFVFASSPDRGLVAMLRVWPEVLKRLPDAELHVTYGWRGCERLGLGNDAAWTKRYENNRRAFEKLKHQKGVVLHGMVNHERLVEILRASSVWTHPSMDADGIDFPETCCTLAIEARASGAVPVVQPVAALNETALCEPGIFANPRDEKDWVDALVRAAETPDEARAAMSAEAIDKFSLSVFMPQWQRILGG